MKWTVLLEQAVDDGRVHALVPWSDLIADAESVEQVLEQVQALIVADLAHTLARGAWIDSYEYLPSLDIIEVPLPTEAEIVASLESTSCDIHDGPISLSVAATRYGMSVFALRRAVVADRLDLHWYDHPELLRPSDIETYLRERAERQSHSDGAGRSARFWRQGPSRRPLRRRRG